MNNDRKLGFMAGDGRFWITSFIEDEEDNCCFACDTDSSLAMIFDTYDKAHDAASNAFGIYSCVYEVTATRVRYESNE